MSICYCVRWRGKVDQFPWRSWDPPSLTALTSSLLVIILIYCFNKFLYVIINAELILQVIEREVNFYVGKTHNRRFLGLFEGGHDFCPDSWAVFEGPFVRIFEYIFLLVLWNLQSIYENQILPVKISILSSVIGLPSSFLCLVCVSNLVGDKQRVV